MIAHLFSDEDYNLYLTGKPVFDQIFKLLNTVPNQRPRFSTLIDDLNKKYEFKIMHTIIKDAFIEAKK